MFLNRKQLMIAIPIWIVLGAYVYLVPIHNIQYLDEHKYDCKTNAEFLQLENGTRIPCKNHSLASEIHFNNTSFNMTKT